MDHLLSPAELQTLCVCVCVCVCLIVTKWQQRMWPATFLGCCLPAFATAVSSATVHNLTWCQGRTAARPMASAATPDVIAVVWQLWTRLYPPPAVKGQSSCSLPFLSLAPSVRSSQQTRHSLWSVTCINTKLSIPAVCPHAHVTLVGAIHPQCPTRAFAEGPSITLNILDGPVWTGDGWKDEVGLIVCGPI